MKQAAKAAAFSVATFVLLLSAVTCYAAADSKSVKIADNNFNPAQIEIAVQENTDSGKDKNTNDVLEKSLNWTEDEDKKGYTAKKEVTVANVSDILSGAQGFIRVCIIPRWTVTLTDADGSSVETDVGFDDCLDGMGALNQLEIADNEYTMGDVTLVLDENWEKNWIYGKDGYFYYRKAVTAGRSTEKLLSEVKMSKTDYDKTVKSGATLKIDVIADSIQTEGFDDGETKAISERWGSPEELGIEAKNSSGEMILEEYVKKDEKTE
jgi:hypothetical protein